MSDPSTVERLVDIAECAKCLVMDSIKAETRILDDSHWNQFCTFCVENDLHDPSEAIDEVPNHVAYYITTRFEG